MTEGGAEADMEVEVAQGAREGTPFRNGCYGGTSATSTSSDAAAAAVAVVRGPSRRRPSLRSGYTEEQPGVARNSKMETARRRRHPRRRWRPAGAVAVGLFSCASSGESALLQLDQKPDRITNQRSVTVTYVCTLLDAAGGCDVKWSLDSSDWEPVATANASVTVEGLLDGLHTLSLKHDYIADGRSETEIVDCEWTVDTVPPETIVDTGPSQEGEAPRPEEADPFLFFTFHCSEDSCSYRYQFDNRLELTATWDDADNSLEGQVSVTSTQQQQQQASAGGSGEEKVLEKLQISVFLTAASSDSEIMPSTVSIYETGGVTAADNAGEAGSSSSSSSVGVIGEGGSDNNATSLATESSIGSSSSSSSSSAARSASGGEEALVLITLGSPEVDSGTGNTVFSLSAEVEVPESIEFNSTLVVKVFTNDSVLLASAPLEESITSKEWLRWPYASELPGAHMVAIAAVDEAGNVDPEPAVWQWSVDARPRTSLTSAPQAVTAADEAFFSFACALPEAETDPSPLEHGALASNNSVEIVSTSDGEAAISIIESVTTSEEQSKETTYDNEEEEEEEDDGGWEIQEGGECTFFFSVDGGNYSAVEPATAAAVVSSTGDASLSPLSSSSSSSMLPPSSNTLLLSGLADGFHELSVYACKANSTECDPQPLSHSWETDTSPPVTSIVSFPDKLTPSMFSFGSSKPLSRFMCKLDSGLWRQCQETSEFPLSDGLHSLVVMAVDPTGRSDPNPVTHSWEVSMLETVVEYCPPSHLRSSSAASSSADQDTTQEEVQVLLGASYGGVSCASAMSCQIRYVLEWEADVPASSGGYCVAPPSPAPTFAPAAPWSSSPMTAEDEENSSDGSSGDDSGEGNDSGDSSGGSSDAGASTPGPTEIGGGSAVPSPIPVGQNYLSRSAVQCLEAWANCTTVEANTTYYGVGGQLASDGTGCTKLETLVGEVGHSHGTLVMRNLPVGAYNLTLEAFNVFGVVDRSPVVCPFQVLAEGETVNQTQIVMVRTPAKILNSPDQAPVLFEFEVEDVAAADNSSSAAASPRLMYLISGPGARDEAWEAVPAVPRDEWDALVLLAGDNNGTSSMLSSSFSSSPSAAVGSGGGSSSDGFVWGLELEGLVDGEYRLQVRDEILGDTAEYTWKADMSVPQLSLDSSPQNPSHSAVSILMMRCSKLSCGLEYQLNGDGVWHLWDAVAAEVEHTHGSRAPTPAPTVSHGLDSSSSSWDPDSESESSESPGEASFSSAALSEGGGSAGGSSSGYGFNGNHVAESGSSGSSSSGGGGETGAYDDGGNYGDGSSAEQEGAVVVWISAQQVSSHELAFRVNVTVPESGNYSFAARPFSSTSTPVYVIGPAPVDGGDGDDDNDRRRRNRLLGSAGSVSSASSISSSSQSSSTSELDSSSGEGDTLTVEWEVDLTRPETHVVSRPNAVTTAGVAAFQFACSLAGEEPRQGCFYQYQMMAVNVEADWDSREWLPTADSVKLYEIGEGVNRIRVRAHDAETELYDLAPAEVVWVRDATAPQLDWLWTPEEVSHLSEALFEFTCSGELPLSSAVLGIDDEEDVQDPANEEAEQDGDSSSALFSSTSSSLRSSSSSLSVGSSTVVGIGDGNNDDDYASSSSVVGAAALAAAYPTAFPRVLPSGCAFEASLDGADFEAVPNAVSLTGLSNGDHRFSVRASDLAGNVAATSHFDWTVDTNVPDTVLVAGPAEVASSTLGSFRILDTVGAQQGQGHFEYRLDPVDDDAPWVSTPNVTLEIRGLEDGPHVLTVRARETEAEGGSSDQVPEVLAWMVDTECPDTTFVVLPDVVTHLTSTVLVVEGGPDAASFEYALDPTDTVITAAADVSSGSTSTTGGGDVGGAGSASGGDGAGGASSSSLSSLPASSSHEEDGGGDGVVWQQGDSSGVIHLHQLEEGRHEIRVRAVDSAGNADPSPATYSWIVDRAGVYGHPSMVTDVVAEGGNKQAFVQWSAAADDGGGALTKYVVIAATAYADINVETITQVYPTTAEEAAEAEQEDGEEGLVEGVLPTETTVTGLTNGLVYSFQVVATNAFGSSTLSLPSNKVLTFDPSDPCGLVTCGDHGSCFIQRSESNALRGYCVCHPGYSGSDCSVVASGTDDSLVLGAYPGSWGECDMKCGGGVRYRTVQCFQYLGGIPMAPTANETTCWEEMAMMAEDDVAVGSSHVQAMSETSCRNVACLAMFLDVTMRLRAFYDDACFTVAAQDAFLSGFAAEVAHALNIKVELVIDLNALHTEKQNEMEVRFIIAPGQTGADQPIENLREQLLLQAASETSSFRTHGTWTRKLIPDSVEVSQGTYELPPLNVTGIASDLVMILMLVGTTCLGVAVYGACASRSRSKKWESVYDGEYGYRDGPQSPGTPSSGGGRGPGHHNDNSISDRRLHGHGGSSGGGSTGSTSSTGGSDAAGRAGRRGGGGVGGGARGVRRNRWFELDDDSEDYDSEDDDWDDDEEDETSPFFGRCALRSLLCRDDDDKEDDDDGDDDGSPSCRRKGEDGDGGGRNRRNGIKNEKSRCSCTCECGVSNEGSGGAGSARVGDGRGCPSGCCCSCENGGVADDIQLTQGPTIDPSNVDPDKLPLPLTGRSRPPPPLSGEAVLHRRRGWGLGGSGSGSSGTGSGDSGGRGARRGRGRGLSAAPGDEEGGGGSGGGTVVRARGLGGNGGSNGAGVQDLDGLVGIQRPGRQAMV